MGYLLLVLGVVVLVAVVVDIVGTTVSATTPGGWGARRLASAVSGLLRRFARGRHRVLRAGGTLLIVGILAIWVLGLWIGWTLVFSAVPEAVLATSTEVPASFWERAYFAGYTIATLGNGEFKPGDQVWQVATVVAALTGLANLTVSITFLVPVINAVTAKRQVANSLSLQGRTAQEMILRSWDGRDLTSLESQLGQWTNDLTFLAQAHYAYPFLHYMHSEQRTAAFAPAVGALDEALMIVSTLVAPGARPDPFLLRRAQDAVQLLLDTLHTAFIGRAAVPPPPRVEALAAAGIPLVRTALSEDELHDRASRRQLLHGFVDDDGWAWSDVSEHDPE